MIRLCRYPRLDLFQLCELCDQHLDMSHLFNAAMSAKPRPVTRRAAALMFNCCERCGTDTPAPVLEPDPTISTACAAGAPLPFDW